MKKTMLSTLVSLLAAGVLMGGCKGVAAEGTNVSGGEEVGEAKQALTSLLLPLAANANFEFETGPNKDLYVIIKAGTGSGMTEVHVLTAASNYTQFSVHTATALHATGTNWDMEIDKATGDLYAIAVNGTGSGKTEIHALSASSNWQTFTVHTETAFGIYQERRHGLDLGLRRLAKRRDDNEPQHAGAGEPDGRRRRGGAWLSHRGAQE